MCLAEWWSDRQIPASGEAHSRSAWPSPFTWQPTDSAYLHASKLWRFQKALSGRHFTNCSSPAPLFYRLNTWAPKGAWLHLSCARTGCQRVQALSPQTRFPPAGLGVPPGAGAGCPCSRAGRAPSSRAR